jgi:methylase of polypeptide subunit release factors
LIASGGSSIIAPAMASLRKYVYDSFARAESPIRRLHKRWFTSPHTTRWLFGMTVLPGGEQTYYYDLTTILLARVLAPKLRANPDARVLEIGTGGYALLAGKLSRLTTKPIDASELDPGRAASSKQHVELNHVNVNVIQSDLFASLPATRYDLIFWNLPYYRDPSGYLANLIDQVPDFLADTGELVIGYNTKPLPRVTVEKLLEGGPLRVVRPYTWWWNLHDVLVIGKR